MEKRTEVKTVRVELVCERCHEGTMEALKGAPFIGKPPLRPHRCTKCSHTDTIADKTYPYMVYE